MSNEEIMELIKRRRRQILVHSFGYYRLNDSIISDHTFDQWSRELAELQSQFPDLASQVELHYEFKDFDGSSGYDLPMGEPWVASVWEHIKREHMRRN
jgi:hypothetical protein